MMQEDKLLHLGMQYFADGDGEGAGEGSTTAGDGASNNNPTENPAEKTFTQAEVNRMMAAEKRQGRASVLNELGIDAKDKDALAKLKQLIDDNKTEGQKQSERLKELETTLSTAEQRAQKAEYKLAVLTMGCNPIYVDDVLTLAQSRVTDTVDFEAALKDVKTKFPAFFGSTDPGTGNSQSHGRNDGKDTKPGSYGARLAANRPKASKSTYFNN